MTTVENAPHATADAAAIRARRRWLYAFALLGLAAVVSVAAVQLLKGGRDDGSGAAGPHATSTAQTVVLERFVLKPPAGERQTGLVELVRAGGRTSIRMIAVKLRPSLADESYQVTLTGGAGPDRLLGGEVVGGRGTFIARANVGAEQLHGYRAIEMRRVTTGGSGAGRLVLSASIPR